MNRNIIGLLKLIPTLEKLPTGDFENACDHLVSLIEYVKQEERMRGDGKIQSFDNINRLSSEGIIKEKGN